MDHRRQLSSEPLAHHLTTTDAGRQIRLASNGLAQELGKRFRRQCPIDSLQLG
jgi:hypothetical protein